MFNKFNFNPFYSPDDAAGLGGELTKGDILDELMKDDETDKDDILEDKTPPKTKEKEADIDDEEKEEDSEEEVDELKELEDELAEEDEEIDDEKLELVTPVRRKEILAKYPKLFHDFPYLEKAYYRDQQFTERFPTFEDADNAISAVKAIESLDEDLMKGSVEKLLSTVKSLPEGSKAFNKLVDNYLPNLAAVDEKAYHHVLGNVIKQTIYAMVQESNNSDNKALRAAAQLLNQFTFGSSKWTAPTKLAGETTEETTKSDDVGKREQAFIQKQVNTYSSELSGKINNSIRSTVVNHIDPKNTMPEYVRKNAIRDVMEQLDEIVDNDSRFKVIKDKLWERAIKNDFSGESINKIREAHLSRAKSVLPTLIKKARVEALKGLGRKVSDSDTPMRGKPSEKNEPSRSNNTSGQRNTKAPKAGQSTLEYLMED